jgi:hypothetical protein
LARSTPGVCSPIAQTGLLHAGTRTETAEADGKAHSKTGIISIKNFPKIT